MQDIFIHIRNKLIVRIKEIVLIEADGKYSRFTTTTGSYLVNTTLTQIEEMLKDEPFCRVNRTYIVPIKGIISIEEDLIKLENREIPLGKQYREKLLSRFIIFK